MTSTAADIGQVITSQRETLAQAVAACLGERGAGSADQIPERERAADDHLRHLAQSLSADSPALFADHVMWARTLLTGRGRPSTDLTDALSCTRDVLRHRLPGTMHATLERYLGDAVQHLAAAPDAPPTCLPVEGPLAPLAHRYLDALLHSDRRTARRAILEALDAGATVRDVYLQVFRYVQQELGRLWQTNRISVAQEHYSTAVTQLIMAELYPRIFGAAPNGYRFLATCVGGDLHEIGLRMVADFLEMDGWDTHYLGADVPTGDVVRTLAERQAHVLGISVTMPYHLDEAMRLIRAVRTADLGREVRILVGGYPFNVDPNLWQTVGADGCASDAEEAVEVAHRLVCDASPQPA